MKLSEKNKYDRQANGLDWYQINVNLSKEKAANALKIYFYSQSLKLYQMVIANKESFNRWPVKVKYNKIYHLPSPGFLYLMTRMGLAVKKWIVALYCTSSKLISYSILFSISFVSSILLVLSWDVELIELCWFFDLVAPMLLCSCWYSNYF